MSTKTITAIPDKIKRNIEEYEKKEAGIYFKGIQMNIRNIKKNIELMRIMVQQININYDYIGLTECWADQKEVNEIDIDIDGYENAHSKNKFNQNGGVHVYINKKHKWKQIEQTEIEEADSVEIEIQGLSKKETKIIIVIYRNPNRNVEKFINEITEKIRKKHYKERNTTIIGDFNIDLNTKNKMADYILDKMSEAGYQQVIKGDTRITETTSSKIDLCFTNQTQKGKITGTIITDITDHYAIYVHTNEGKETKEQKKERERAANSYKVKFNHDEITKEIDEVNWMDISNEKDPEIITRKLQNRINEIRKKNEIRIKQTNHYNAKKK